MDDQNPTHSTEPTDSANSAPTNAAPTHYRQPDWLTRNAFNPAVRGLTSAGISILGSRILEVRGRKSGQLRTTVVNLLTHQGTQYLVAPRGETDWVRNLRADRGHLALRLGRKRTERQAVELVDEGKIEVLRAYLKRWKFEVGVFFDGVGPDSTDAELAAIAERHPVFQLN